MTHFESHFKISHLFCRWLPLAHSLLDITNLVIVSLYGQCIVQQVKWNANKLNTKISSFTTSDIIKPIAFLLESSFSGKIYCYSSGQQFIYIFIFPIHCKIKNVLRLRQLYVTLTYKYIPSQGLQNVFPILKQTFREKTFNGIDMFIYNSNPFTRE